MDTDEDGLTDYEEFFLRTDPRLNDTDRDGIEDRVESLGYALGHKVGTLDIGIIKTDPLVKTTSVPGVFACGDAAMAAGSVTFAMADGARAGFGAHRSLIFR